MCELVCVCVCVCVCAEFGCSSVLDNPGCNEDDYLPGGRLAEGATLEFTAGDPLCSETVDLEADDRFLNVRRVRACAICLPVYSFRARSLAHSLSLTPHPLALALAFFPSVSVYVGLVTWQRLAGRWVCPGDAVGESCPPEYIVNITLDRASSTVPDRCVSVCVCLCLSESVCVVYTCADT